jgi:type II secretory pathway component PulM
MDATGGLVLASPGQLPVATVPLGIVASLAFALWPSLEARTRLTIMLGGTLIFLVFAWLVG